jgi:hypothetical protein
LPRIWMAFLQNHLPVVKEGRHCRDTQINRMNAT